MFSFLKLIKNSKNSLIMTSVLAIFLTTIYTPYSHAVNENGIVSSLNFSSIDDRQVIKNIIDNKLENDFYVFFYYACEHCFNINDKLNNDIKNNKNIEKVPFVFSGSTFSSMSAKHYYTAKALGVEERFSKIYYKFVSQRKNIDDYIALRILEELGVDKMIAQKAMNSLKVDKDVKRASDLSYLYRVKTTPYFVNGTKQALLN